MLIELFSEEVYYNFKIEAGGYVSVNGSFNFMKSDSIFSSYQLVPYVEEESDSTAVGIEQ